MEKDGKKDQNMTEVSDSVIIVMFEINFIFSLSLEVHRKVSTAMSSAQLVHDDDTP